ncbi:MAG: hypothetical protein H0T46_29950 [Deltaproteobacteria bacterium]|nr:hypothetical protein [Deltaproteobacteria bacterium]
MRLGWLGPVIVLVGIAAAVAGLYLVMTSKPKAGAVIETIVIDPHAKIVVRAEDGGDRAFVELHVGDEMKWQALVPHYGGRTGATGIAWGETAVSVRVVRDNKAEVFALAIKDASKLGGVKLGAGKGPIKLDATGPVTLTDNLRSYEVVSGEGWNQMTAIDLRNGSKLWTIELGAAPITSGGVKGGLVWIEQAGTRRYFQVFTGQEDRSSETTGAPLDPTPAP